KDTEDLGYRTQNIQPKVGMPSKTWQLPASEALHHVVIFPASYLCKHKTILQSFLHQKEISWQMKAHEKQERPKVSNRQCRSRHRTWCGPSRRRWPLLADPLAPKASLIPLLTPKAKATKLEKPSPRATAPVVEEPLHMSALTESVLLALEAAGNASSYPARSPVSRAVPGHEWCCGPLLRSPQS
ncbi:hypothetical protein J0S82_020278, partial [Galemys pyrenaicus]